MYSGRYLIIGPPGTGKTRRVAASVKRILDRDEGPVLVCSLTRTAAAEASGRCEGLSRDMVGTLHSHAYRALGRPNMAEAAMKEWNENHAAYVMRGENKSVDDPLADHEAQNRGDEMLSAYALLRARRVDRSLWHPRIKAFAEPWEAWKTDTGRIDFTDMIENALNEPPPFGARVLIADEAQDHSALECELLRRWGEAAGAEVLVGDSWQSLYEWRGSHPESLKLTSVTEDHRDVLGQSYRVPRRVHAAAMAWVSDLSDYEPIRYTPRDADGEVTPFEATWREPAGIADLAAGLASDGESVMIATSCGYMLEPLIGALRSAAIPYANPWRRRRGDWNPLHVSRGTSSAVRLRMLLEPGSAASRDADADADFDFGWNEDEEAPVSRGTSDSWTLDSVATWSDLLRATGVIRRGWRKKLDSLGEVERSRIADGDVLHEVFESESAGLLTAYLDGRAETDEVLAWVERSLSPQRKSAAYAIDVARRHGVGSLSTNPRIYIGTIHSFKGAEADNVILFPDLSSAGHREWQTRSAKDRIIRLFYVGLTRAKSRVFLCRQSSHLAVPLR